MELPRVCAGAPAAGRLPHRAKFRMRERERLRRRGTEPLRCAHARSGMSLPHMEGAGLRPRGRTAGGLTLSHSGGACEKLGLPEHAEAGASGSSGSTRMAAFSGCRGNGMPGADTAAVRATLGRKGTARLACRHVHVAGHCGEAANGGRRRFYRILNRRPKNADVPESGFDRLRGHSQFPFAGMCRYGIPGSRTRDTTDRAIGPACRTRRRNGVATI